MKSGQNLKYDKDYFQTGLTQSSRRNNRDILYFFMQNESLNKKARNIKRNNKIKK